MSPSPAARPSRRAPSVPPTCGRGRIGDRIPRASALRLLAMGGVGVAMLSGCRLVDQRTFDASAGRAPVPRIPYHVPAPVVPPFLMVRAGTPGAEWRPAVDHAVRVALARRPGVLFVLTGMTSDASSPGAQAQALGRIASGDEQAIADAIIAAGARPLQVQMRVRTDPGGAARTQVDVH